MFGYVTQCHHLAGKRGNVGEFHSYQLKLELTKTVCEKILSVKTVYRELHFWSSTDV